MYSSASGLFAWILLTVLPCLVQASQFKVIEIIDGRTVKANGHDIDVSIRFIGIGHYVQEAACLSRKLIAVETLDFPTLCGHPKLTRFPCPSYSDKKVT